MRIGNGWTKTTQDGNTFISTSLDDAFLQICPQLKGCNLTLSHIKAEERKSENSPGWNINLSIRRDRTERAAEQSADNNNAAMITDEEIPF